MNLHDLVSQLIIDTKGAAGALLAAPTADSSLRAYLPELVLCLTILALLAIRLPRWGWRVDTFWVALIGSAAALYYAAPWECLGAALSRLEARVALEDFEPLSLHAWMQMRLGLFHEHEVTLRGHERREGENDELLNPIP